MYPFSRKYDDEPLFTAAWNNIRSIHTRAKMCMPNRTVPAPLDENPSIPSTFRNAAEVAPDFADFYEALYDEVKDRGDRGIEAVPKEWTYYLKARV